ncbi:glutamate-gated chloride channel [Trichonephila inaurata madagascariensis]|uniref:Glutamate-gated chloride channel n=1 Tax=Trichonephila inaurata madagascariensis TaxID=2747483 RepID=A0A8X6XG99_9ARAC|nr:glutamate-gated chloride channel [Trichonephila inaurata madagascariensis]
MLLHFASAAQDSFIYEVECRLRYFLQSSFRSRNGNYSCLRVLLVFTRDKIFYFSTVFGPGVVLVTSSFISFWLDINAVPARVMIGVTTMLNFCTTTNSFRSTLPVVSNLTAMNLWDGVCMFFIYASMLEFIIVNYLYRKYPHHPRGTTGGAASSSSEGIRPPSSNLGRWCGNFEIQQSNVLRDNNSNDPSITATRCPRPGRRMIPGPLCPSSGGLRGPSPSCLLTTTDRDSQKTSTMCPRSSSPCPSASSWLPTSSPMPSLSPPTQRTGSFSVTDTRTNWPSSVFESLKDWPVLSVKVAHWRI